MRDWGYIPDPGNSEPCRLEGADGRFTPTPRSLNIDLNLFYSMLHPFPRRLFGSKLRGIGSSLARSFKTSGARTPPCDDIARRVGKCNDGIVEGRLDIGKTLGDGLSLPSFNPGWFLLICHSAPLLPGHGAATSGNRLACTLFGSGIGSSTLTMNRQPTAMPDATVATDLDKPLNVEIDLPP